MRAKNIRLKDGVNSHLDAESVLNSQQDGFRNHNAFESTSRTNRDLNDLNQLFGIEEGNERDSDRGSIEEVPKGNVFGIGKP